MHTEVSDTASTDNTHCATVVKSPFTSGLTTSDHQYCAMAASTIQEGNSVREVSDGNEDKVMEEVCDDINLVSYELFHHSDVVLEDCVQDSQVQHTEMRKSISNTADHSYSGVFLTTQKLKLHSKIQKVGKKLGTCLRRLKLGKQKNRR